jgi:CBS domain containing-hemolysin-like protein
MTHSITLVGEALVVVALVAANAFFVAAEFALVKVRAGQLRPTRGNGGWRERMALRATDRLEVMLSATQLGVTLASLGLGWVGKPLIAGRLEPLLEFFGVASPATVEALSFATAFGVITFFHIVFGELAPKSLAIQRPHRITLLVAGPLLAFYCFFFPVIWLLNHAANRFLHWMGLGPEGREAEYDFSAGEFEYILGRARHAHPAEALVNRLMLRATRLPGLTADQLMSPGAHIQSLWLARTMEENLVIAQRSGYSRLVLCGRSLDDVRGVVLVREWLWELRGRDPLDALVAVARPALFFGAKTPVHEMIARFRSDRMHLALVRDPSGRIVGLVTFEDVIEELLGNIRDESDHAAGAIHAQTEQFIVVNITLPMRELQAETGWTFDVELGESVGGWISRRSGRDLMNREKVIIGDFAVSCEEVGVGGKARIERRQTGRPGSLPVASA